MAFRDLLGSLSRAPHDPSLLQRLALHVVHSPDVVVEHPEVVPLLQAGVEVARSGACRAAVEYVRVTPVGRAAARALQALRTDDGSGRGDSDVMLLDAVVEALLGQVHRLVVRGSLVRWLSVLPHRRRSHHHHRSSDVGSISLSAIVDAVVDRADEAPEAVQAAMLAHARQWVEYLIPMVLPAALRHAELAGVKAVPIILEEPTLAVETTSRRRIGSVATLHA
jgi:hypothetical protein